MSKQSNLRAKHGRNKRRNHEFARYSAAIYKARAIIAIEDDKAGRFRDGERPGGRGDDRAKSMRAYWDRVLRLANEIYGKKAPVGFRVQKGGLYTGKLTTGKLRTGSLKTGNLKTGTLTTGHL